MVHPSGFDFLLLSQHHYKCTVYPQGLSIPRPFIVLLWECEILWNIWNYILIESQVYGDYIYILIYIYEIHFKSFLAII